MRSRISAAEKTRIFGVNRPHLRSPFACTKRHKLTVLDSHVKRARIFVCYYNSEVAHCIISMVVNKLHHHRVMQVGIFLSGHIFSMGT